MDYQPRNRFLGPAHPGVPIWRLICTWGYPFIDGWFLSWKVPNKNGWTGVPLWLRKPFQMEWFIHVYTRKSNDQSNSMNGWPPHDLGNLHLPSGQLSHNHGKSPCYSWVNPLFLWSCSSSQTLSWLVVSTPLKNISQLGWLFPIYGKITNVPNHQPVSHYRRRNRTQRSASAPARPTTPPSQRWRRNRSCDSRLREGRRGKTWAAPVNASPVFLVGGFNHLETYVCQWEGWHPIYYGK